MRLDFALVIGVIFLVDQCTKLLASTYLNYAEPVGLLPFFSFTLLHNTGAAFSFLADAGGWQQWLFLVLAVGISTYSIWSLRDPELCGWMQAGFVLLIPGAPGLFMIMVRSSPYQSNNFSTFTSYSRYSQQCHIDLSSKSLQVPQANSQARCSCIEKTKKGVRLDFGASRPDGVSIP
jgi:hypothetical protein